MAFLRSVSAKLLLAISVAVLLPFFGFSYFVNTEMGNRLSRDVVLYFLKSKASDLADKVNLFLEERQKDLRIWAADPAAREALAHPRDPGRLAALEDRLNLYVREKEVYDLLVLAEPDGTIVATNSVDRYGTFLPPQAVLRRDLREFDWFRDSLEGRFQPVDWHSSPLVREGLESRDPKDYHIGFAGPVWDAGNRQVVGVWFNLVNWSFIQVDILDRVKRYFGALTSPESYKSGYAWLWKQDADHIIGHQNRALYGKRVSQDPVNLPQLRDAALQERWGVFPEYEWPPGVPKNAAFCWTRTEKEGGFGWIVGLGIDNEDILATVTELRQVLLIATVLILGGIVLWISIISRTITGPVKTLIRFTEEVARDDLQSRIAVESQDEIGVLARSFNRMTGDLAASRERLIRAEKEAAWREMARQVAHEIKNPLTPIRLSATLLQKAYEDRSPEFGKILGKSTETILRQIDSLTRIAADFSAFAGLPKRNLQLIAVRPLAEECLGLYEAWSRERRIGLSLEGSDGTVSADRDEIRRVLINLLDNAFDAVRADGTVRTRLCRSGETLTVEVTDSGPGIPPEVQGKLFQPYFSTKTDGTGLGLAICRRIVTDLGGEIGIRCDGGTTVWFRLPLHEAKGSPGEDPAQ